MSPTSYRAAPPRDDPRSVPDASEAVNRTTTLRPRPGHVAISLVGPGAAGRQVLRLDRGDLVGGDAMLGDLGTQTVEARRVAAEDGALHRAVGRAQRPEAV